MKKKLVCFFIGIGCLLSSNDINADILLTSSSGGSLSVPNTIALSFSKSPTNEKTEKLKDIKPQDLEKFLLYVKHAQQKLAQRTPWRKIIEELSQQDYVTQPDELCKLINLGIFLDQLFVTYALAKKYVSTYASTREAVIYPEFPLLPESKILLRKSYFLHHNDPSTMIIRHTNGEQSIITLTLEEVVLNRRILIENSKFDLSNLFLSSLDGIKPWLMVPQAQQLDISNNYLRTLPDELAHGTYLQRIDASHNVLEHLPDSICTLPALEKIDISNNNLRELPQTIGNLKKLIRIDAHHNILTSLPESIGDCESLRWLTITHNKIEQLPTTLSTAKNLNRLKADEEVIQKISSKNE